ncbi:MAG TPA: diaminopimelate decarboxylase [Verrucomicrobia bacterium]|nr:diaminopimelate decarboxylase [Verrucomicrobiota bacterium]
MKSKVLPFDKTLIERICDDTPTPFHLYDEAGIRANARALKAAFTWNPGFREYFAVKATPNPYIMKLLKSEGFGADCSSGPELTLAECVGLRGKEIMFTSNDTPAAEFRMARDLGAIINLDDISHINFLDHHAGLPEIVCFRYNPGPLREGNTIIGHPEEAKYGFTRAQLFEGYRILRDRGIKHFGLHTMVASNELNGSYFVETAKMLFELVAEISLELGIRFDIVNLGGGIGIPYRPEQTPVDLDGVGRGIRDCYEKMILKQGLSPLALALECGRMVTGPFGYLVSTVRHLKHTYRDYVGLDACMADLMRPGMYGAYHHITVLNKPNALCDHVYDVTGSLCENNDKFAIQRALPEIQPGDVIVIHDAGAHGHAMGFNYNGKLRHAEFLLRRDGSFVMIRRNETEADLFATLDFAGLDTFNVET